MTNEEAILNIDMALSEVEWQYPMDYAVAFKMAIEAIEKQIPKKLAILPEPYINAKKYGCCPNCQWTEIDYRWGMREGTTITYCPRCGQSLLWAEEDNDR